MKTSVISAVVFVLVFSHSDAANCTGLPAELSGVWRYEGDGDALNGQLDINLVNLTRTIGGDSSTFTCLLSEEGTYLLKEVGGNGKKYLCLAYTKINDNVVMTYIDTENNEDEPTAISDICDDDLNEYPKPGSLLYTANTLTAVQCPLLGKFEFQRDDCENKTKTYKLEVCSGDYKALTYTPACDTPLAPFISGNMDCLGAWNGEDGLKYAIVKTADIGDDDTTWAGKFACMVYKEPDVNNTVMMTAQDFQCGSDQTEDQTVEDGWIETLKKVNTAEECLPPSTDTSGANTVLASVMSFVLCVVVALKL